ncbi:MAG TPA: carboxypeptidase regulatory-like domain-containing protein [Terriglobales bacterium]|nr:carboxypeptidase regulatory-like domain-containing protein [Terriglobales bacterium]HVA64124.1 carboxypeptidase regulatory-like domain-containing protein [Terriglobales bacterium]
MKPFFAMAALAAGLALGASLPADAQQMRGSLSGTVADASGARVPGAKVVAHEPGTTLSRQATADVHGDFRMLALLPGSYELTVTAPGFAAAHAAVRVVVGSPQAVEVRLTPASGQQSVTVRGEASSITTQPLDTTSAVEQGVVTAHDLATIPLAARSFANIAYLTPGTEPVEPSDPTKARITAVSFGGSSGLNVTQSVDGGNNSDDYIGGFLQNFSPDAIQEFVVRTAGEAADTGGTTAGSVVVTTKRGTDQWHGLAGIYARGSALNARFPIDNPAPDPKQPFSRQNYVGTLGGPIKSGKLWTFNSLEYVNEAASIAYSPASLQQFQALAGLAGQGLLPGVNSIATSNSTPVPFHDLMASTRLDWSQSARSQWFVRLSSDSYLTRNDLVQQATLGSTGATSHSNYLNGVLSQQYIFNPNWLGSFVFDASYLHHTEERNTNLGYALAFPFSATASTISGFETFGDNQFVTPITAFPVMRNQEKYELRYTVSHTAGSHAPEFGVDFIHEPVLSGALPGTAENLTLFALNPTAYAGNPAQFTADLNCAANATPGTSCTNTPAGDGSFSQNVQRLGVFMDDSWHATDRLVVNYGLRYDTTFGLFTASGRSQAGNPALLTLAALQVPFFRGVPHDYRKNFAPRLGLVYALGKNRDTVLRAGGALLYNDLAQNGWVSALQAVNAPPVACAAPGDPGCLPGGDLGGVGALIDPNYKTPYALQATAGVQHAFTPNWTLAADFTHEEGNHAYRRYEYTAGYTLFSPLAAQDVADQRALVPDVSVFRTDNRSRYDALAVHLQGNINRRLNLVANYTFASASTWGCVVGELFDYVNGVCNPLNAFAPGDYGPSGEDVRHRLVVAGTYYAPGGLELSLLAQAESARPFTLTTPASVNGVGDPTNDRAVVNGVQTSLDQFRGSPYSQVDLRVSRPFVHEHVTGTPFVEFFNLFNRNNPGNNYVADLSALPVPVNDLTNATAFCLNASCSQTQAITSLNQLRVPAGALGDFFGPGTTVGIPFAAQVGFRLTF